MFVTSPKIRYYYISRKFMTQVTKQEKRFKNRHSFAFVFLERLTRNSIFLLLLICLLLFAFYLIGNFQGFIDKSQLIILRVLSVCSVGLCIMSVTGFILETIFLFMKEKKAGLLFSMLFFIFTFVTGFAFIVFSTVIRRIATGI